ncbi:MAG: HAMP domain-containing histidine kinase [Anaerolineae bacterium]|nr:HAMP domain-containing histidine kinase [Anaerolineae bacterium]
MSIRLRLTLLYSLILALTLVAFSLIIYVTQAQASLNSSKKTLAVGAEYLIEGPLTHRPIGKMFKLPTPAKLGTFLQIRTLDGDVLNQSPPLDESLVLPLSEEALQAARRGETWVEITPVDSERLLIHNQPFTAEDGTPLILQLAGSLAGQDQNLNTLGQILSMGSIAAVIVAFGGGWLLAGLTLRPINRLRQTAQTIGTEQDFNRRVDHTGPNDEIGQLATTFNDMLAQLQAAYMQVEETLQAQRRLVADASHELRTPLTTLRGNIGLLQRQPPVSGEDRADILADMVDETERLMRLVNDLLVLARADAGRPLRQEPVALKPLLDDVYQQVKLLAPHRTICYQPAANITVVGNNDALKQVLLILLDNAFKHTPPEASVTLTTAVNNGHVTIKVADDGPGISPAHLPHIFDRFYRGDEARSGPGAGLGLAIANELTQAQQGTLTVQSQPGQGTTFILTLPSHHSEAELAM